jgi:glycosyltransferase involved in cell wall biosynthesis
VHVPDGQAPASPTDGPLLYVGERARAYKNVGAVLTALTRLDRGVRLVCFGGGPFTDAERARLHELGLAGRVSWRAGDDDDLAGAYREARALVYPSRWEGFGLPALEAMAHGCPVVCTNTGSLTEVVGDAALTFDPVDIDMLVDVLTRVIADDACAAALSKAGHERAAAFTWDATATRTIEAYRQVVG